VRREETSQARFAVQSLHESDEEKENRERERERERKRER
jgi:hypothetical protein